MIDTTKLQSRLDIILKVLKDNLLKIDQVQEDISRKRRKTELFDVSQTNTSTPESTHPLKKRRIATSLNTSIIESDVITSNKKDLNFISSPETSNKEDDVSDEEAINPTVTNNKIAPPPEVNLLFLLNRIISHLVLHCSCYQKLS